ncbi:MAG: hypothetical protein H0T53_12005, partial [Herpetosiphonaceae bacterium]|nr:hypothetical protein [Herpetosiphonaceae bacterium]
MIPKAIAIALAYLQMIARNRSFLIQMFVIPIMLTFIIGQAIGGGSDELPDPTTTWRVNIVNEDAGQLGLRLIEYVKKTPRLDVQVVDRQTAMDAVARA